MERELASKITVPALRARKGGGSKIIMLTAYDATFARLLDSSGVDILLCGDSLGMVIKGEENTLSVTLEEVLYHTRAVARGTRQAQVVADLPFLSYQVSLEDGIRSAGRLIKEGGAEAVKLEGGRRHADLVRRLTEIGIPVMGHLGLTPQSIHAMGGYKVQGRGEDASRELLADAVALEEAGAYSLVLEGIPLDLARTITERLRIPTIGIGAGPHCDGQVLVIYDLLGLDERFEPRFLKRYDDLAARVRRAVTHYAEDVQAGNFPTVQHSFSSKNGARERSGSEVQSQPPLPPAGVADPAAALAPPARDLPAEEPQRAFEDTQPLSNPFGKNPRH